MTDGLQVTWSTKVLSFLCGIIVSGWISLGVSVQVLMILMVIDMACGMMLASRQSKLSSKRGMDGVTKKAGVLIVVILVHILQYLAEHQVGAGFALPIHIGSAVANMYCLIEAVSIIENCHSLGAPIPNVLTASLRKALTITDIDPEIKQIK